MKRIAASCLAVVLAAFSFNFAPVAHAGSQSTKPVADIQSSPVEAEPQDPQSQTQGTSGGQENPFRRDTQPEIKSYDRVITKDAKTDNGVFNIHRIKEKVYYEIPKSELGKDFLWVSQIARTTLGVGYGGQAAGRHVVRWERYNNRVLLRSVSFEVVADRSCQSRARFKPQTTIRSSCRSGSKPLARTKLRSSMSLGCSPPKSPSSVRGRGSAHAPSMPTGRSSSE